MTIHVEYVKISPTDMLKNFLCSYAKQHMPDSQLGAERIGMKKNLSQMVASGEITVDELSQADKLIKRAKLVRIGLAACKRNLVFPLGETEIKCYDYFESLSEYESWGKCSITGNFVVYSNWNGQHKVGECNLTDFQSVFLSFENKEFSKEIERFLKQQIEMAAIK